MKNGEVFCTKCNQTIYGEEVKKKLQENIKKLLEKYTNTKYEKVNIKNFFKELSNKK